MLAEAECWNPNPGTLGVIERPSLKYRAPRMLYRSRLGDPIGILSPPNPLATVSVSSSSAQAPYNGPDGFL